MQAHPQAEAEAGANGDSHGIQLVWCDPRRCKRLLHAAVDGGLVRLLRQLGHHPAPFGVDVGLAGQALAQHAAAGADHRHARVVTAALDAQDEAGAGAGRWCWRLLLLLVLLQLLLLGRRLSAPAAATAATGSGSGGGGGV